MHALLVRRACYKNLHWHARSRALRTQKPEILVYARSHRLLTLKVAACPSQCECNFTREWQSSPEQKSKVWLYFFYIVHAKSTRYVRCNKNIAYKGTIINLSKHSAKIHQILAEGWAAFDRPNETSTMLLFQQVCMLALHRWTMWLNCRKFEQGGGE